MRMIQMDTNIKDKIIYPELSYAVNGIFFDTHTELGRYSREKQYGDLIEKKLKGFGVPYQRELTVGDTGNILDFLIDEKLVVEIKAKRMVTREDYFQTQRYLQILAAKLGVIVNFRDKYLKPIRIVRIDTNNKIKFV